MTGKILQWNVNSFTARLEFVQKLLRDKQSSILCPQETNCSREVPQRCYNTYGLRASIAFYDYLSKVSPIKTKDRGTHPLHLKLSVHKIFPKTKNIYASNHVKKTIPTPSMDNNHPLHNR
ncbi:hypothetical protein WN51_12872 [Melipona quadrifasciata]|uniref:Endonuclease/exonuclease/phosphatase domain-containing protein n=1 Tax=Melipona quadrifasciata TaxID=166423 RepID=A0A0M9A2Q1_9HYME|nr:hypothetical protein WN51_12872 [Melipona quadrifasciata]